MKRTAIAAAWVAGATIPLLMAAVFVFGCCVLPFHHVIHKVMPLCHTAVAMLMGGHQEEKAPPAKAQRFDTEAPQSARLRVVDAARIHTSTAIKHYRSFITLGAVRCDRDVGLHVLDDTFLI